MRLEINSSFWMLLLLFLLPSCQSLEKLYEAGEYKKAFRAACKRLDQKEEDKSALYYLKESLNELITSRLEQFTILSSTNTAEEWEQGLDVIAEMDGYIDDASKFLSAPFADEQKEWWAAAVALEEKLYLLYLENGKRLLAQSKTQDDAAQGRAAYYEFERAIHYKRDGFPEEELLNAYLLDAQKEGTVYYKVAIDDGFNIGLGVDVNAAFRSLEQQGGLFLDIEKAFIADGGDCAIDISFGEFDTEIRETQEQRPYEKQIIVGYEVQVDTSGNETEIPIYEEVRAIVEVITSTKTAKWDVRVDVDQHSNNCTVFGERYQRELTSTITYYRVNGDERAVHDVYRNNHDEEEHLSDEDMAEEILENLVRLIYADYFD